MSQLNQNQSPTPRMHILRLFGMDRATLTQLLKEAAAQGCPGLRLLEQNGEQAVCIRARGDSAEDLQLAALWADELERLVRDVCFGRGSDGLPQAFAAALTGREWLVVTPDEATGRLLDPVMESLPQGRTLYDFGRQSWADEKTAPRLKPRAGDDRLTGAARSGLAALKATDADLALILLPAAEAEPAAAMAVSGRAAWVRALSGEQAAEAAARNWLLELGRRMALELPAPAGTAEFVPGKRAPELPPLPAPGPVPEVEAPELPVWHAPAPQKSDPEDWRGAPTRAFAEPDSPAAPQEEQLRAALNLYDLAGEEDDGPAPYSRPQKGSWKKVLACLLVVLALCAAAAAYAWTSRNAGQGPSPRGYGTIAFDQAAAEYLAGARAKDGQVAAYLALPGQRGALVYSTDEPGAMSAGGAVYADEAEPGQVKPGTRAWLEPGSDPARAHSNTLVWCPGEALGYLDRLDQQDVLAANYGFTLYTPDGVSRCKAAAVFRWNAEGDALPLTELQDLTNYRDYLTFVLGVKARSLFELPVDIRDTDRFVTLLAPTGEGEYLAVVGRMVREDESASVNTAAIAAAEAPLDPADEAAAAASNQKWMGWVIASGETNGQLQEEVGMPEHDLTLEQLLQVLENMPDIQVLPAYTMSPLPTAAPTEEPTATPAATLEPGATASPTPVPTPTPEPTATPGPGETPAPTAAPTAVPTAAPTATPTAAPTPPPSGGAAGMTINVTMNGTRQTMDLVECLAMVCQNELGYHAPAEAVKAQAVAAHSWVLSQGGYPSVSGITPTQTTRDLVAQVATQVVVYNGSVAFTPYYASASYGTCSSQEVWGGVRPYLIPVASPWDEVYATNWRTVKSYPAADLAQRVLERLGEDLYAYSENKADWIGELSKNQYGYVLDMRVGNAHLSGSRFKQYIVNQLCGITLRSAAFDVEYDAGSDSFVFTVLGYGHGCGMSQHGAMGAAKEGWSYSQILAHYYPGTSLAVIG